MGRRKLSPADKAARIIRRDNARQEQEAKRGRLTTWFQQRAEKAEARKHEARQARVDGTPANHRAHDVLAAHIATQPTPKPRGPEPRGLEGQVDGTLGTYRGYVGPYRERRARGQRGHDRKPRRRELPGAQQRRIERNRKSNVGAW